MPATINSVCSIDTVSGNTLLLEVIPNNLQNNQLQFYYLNNNSNNINYIKFDEYNNKFKECLKRNSTIYITFCGININDKNVPDYLYLVFSGNDVQYRGLVNNSGSIFLELKLNKPGQTIEYNLKNLFTNNIGVFIQGYL